jgi:hypothetical protein
MDDYMNVSGLRITDELNLEALLEVIHGRTCILVVRQFCSEEVAFKIGAWLLEVESERYDHEIQRPDGIEYVYYGVDRVGMPFNKTIASENQEAMKETYYQQALVTIRNLRAAAAPFLSPLDDLRLVLDEIWPDGAGIAAFEGRKMLVGIGRVMHAGNSAASETPHFDAISPKIIHLEAQLAANIFVITPESGGELEVWNVPPVFFGMETPPDRGENWRNELPEPVMVRPNVGDLILFNSSRPHAIRRFAQGRRISVQCFIGFRHSTRLDVWN